MDPEHVDVEDTVLFIIENLFEPAEITGSSKLHDDLQLDDDRMAELLGELKNAFGVDIPLERAEGLTTVQSLVEYIEDDINTDEIWE
ncbi:hypothetical protein BJX68DRAFT_273165 [Aspergillus pseudodeflectus]|uniref:Carrier domain-containing protein n=1 Tax=Aspergillus pseudodeflectus TaxID=176178 RepID=A0ABR4JE11_9EURO